MLSVSSLTSGKGFYYTNLAREDYYMEGGEPPGRWVGDTAQKLGLTGPVRKDHLANLLQGFGPDGQKLVQNAGKETRQAGLDLTFSAPKSVSVLWALGGEDTRTKLEHAHSRAVEKALQYVDQEAGWTRRGKDGAEFERCELAFAAFQHSTSRAQDPNLHTHVLVPNVGLREDGSTGALWNRELYLHKMAAGALYRVALAYELGPHGLGLPLEADPDRGFFRLAGVAEELDQHFSKRRAQIEFEHQKQGYSKTARAFAKAATGTREVKGHIARDVLFERWEGEARELGWTREKLSHAVREHRYERPHELTATLEKLVRNQAENLAETRATFRPQDLVRASCSLGQHGGIHPDDLLRVTREHLASGSVTELARGKRTPILTTKRQLDREGSLLTVAASLDDMRGLTVSPVFGQAVKEAHGNARAFRSAEHEAAFDYLTQTTGNVKVLAGAAGTGKTSILKAAREAWEKEGFRVVGMALSGKAARELEQGSGIQSETVRKRELQLSPTLRESMRHHLRGAYRAARWGRVPGFKESGTMDRLKLDSKTVVVIDESSMLGLEDTSKMLRRAAAAGSKVVLVGDERQLPAIESVSAFEAIGRHVGRFELTDVKRQRMPWMRDAVLAFAQGDSQGGFAILQENGALKLSQGGPAATREQLISDWSASKAAPDEKLILTATNEEARDFNARAQKARLDARELRTIFSAKLGSGETAYIGDRVLFLKTHRGIDVRNGETGTVLAFDRAFITTPLSPGALDIRMDDGRKVRVDLKKYRDMSLGYALTTHKAQGCTVDEAFVYTTPERAALDMVYVQTSRQREALSVYAPGHDLGEDLAALERAARTPSAENTLAVSRRFEAEREQELARAREEEEERRRGLGEGYGVGLGR